MKMAGIDVHKKVLMVVVMDTSTPHEKPVRRRFITLPNELQRLLTWLREQGVEEAVMESTAQYWRSVWLELEPHLRLHLAAAFSNRAPRGRKHDFQDAELLEHDPDEAAAHARSSTTAEPDRVFAGRNADQVVDCGEQSPGGERIAHSACFGQRRDRSEEVGGTGWGAVAVYRGATGRCFDGKST